MLENIMLNKQTTLNIYVISDYGKKKTNVIFKEALIRLKMIKRFNDRRFCIEPFLTRFLKSTFLKSIIFHFLVLVTRRKRGVKFRHIFRIRQKVRLSTRNITNSDENSNFKKQQRIFTLYFLYLTYSVYII